MFNNILSKQLFTHFCRNKKILFNEKTKMLKNKVYNPAFDLPLFNERMKCKKLCREYNLLLPNSMHERGRLISRILGKTGNVFFIEQPFMCDYGYNIELGENFASNHNLLILDSAKVSFGDNVMVGPNCSFITSKHPLNPSVRKEGLQWAEPIIVEDDVWICSNVTVLAGVRIGAGSVISAGSLVTKDIPSNSLAMGIPCKVVKKLIF